MDEHERDVERAGGERASARERYELEHLARKHGLLAPLAKTALREEDAMRGETDLQIDRPKRSAG